MSEEKVEKAALHVFDYVIIVVTFLTSLGIGIFFGIRGRKHQTREDYFLGKRHMNLMSVSLSLFVTYMSAISLMGAPAEVYSFGGFFSLTAFSVSLSYILGTFTVVPLFYGLRTTSVFEYFERRFQSRTVRILGASLGILNQLMYTAVTLLTPALALQTGAGVPIWVTVAAVGIVGTVYTSLGGLKSVIWTDVFQSIIMGIGVTAVLVRGLIEIGSARRVWELGYEGGRLDFNHLNPDPRVRHTYWSILLGATFTFFSFTFSQSTVQRTCSVRSLRAAKLAYLVNIPLVFISKFILCFTGLLVYAYFHSVKCDPFQAGYISNKNEIMPYFVMHILGSLPGLSGLYIATLFSASLSTLSSFINALSANTVEDILKAPLERFRATEKTTTVVAKVSVCFFGGLAIGLVYMARALQGTVLQMAVSVVGACGGPLTGMFCLGAIFPGANKYGALAGGATAVTINIWLTLGKQLYGKKTPPLPFAPSDNCGSLTGNHTLQSYNQSVTNTTPVNESPATSFFLYDISYFYFAMMGIIMVQIVGIIVSKCTASLDNPQPDPLLLFPFARRLWRIGEPSSSQNNLSYLQMDDVHKNGDHNHTAEVPTDQNLVPLMNTYFQVKGIPNSESNISNEQYQLNANKHHVISSPET